MRRALVLLSLGSALACTRPAAAPPSPPAPVAPAAPIEDCTLETKLVEGVPGSPGHLIASERNPNGASELATLMRRFVDDWKAAKGALKADAGVATNHLAAHRRIRCSWPTDPGDRNVTFDGYAQGYVKAVSAFDAAPSVATYEQVLDACKACHEVSCGGPLTVIEGLRFDAAN